MPRVAQGRYLRKDGFEKGRLPDCHYTADNLITERTPAQHVVKSH